MTFIAVYTISKDYEPICGKIVKNEELIPDSIIRSGLIGTIRAMPTNVSDNFQITTQEVIEGIIFFAKQYGPISTIIASNQLFSFNKIADEVSWKFFRKFSNALQTNIFQPDDISEFNQTIEKAIASVYQDKRQVIPKDLKELTSLTIFELPKELKDVAKLLLTNVTTTVKDITEALGITEKIARDRLNRLIEQGYVTQHVEDTLTIYSANVFGDV